MDVTTASALCRFLRDAGALLLWGGGLYRAALAPRALKGALESAWVPLRRAALLLIVLALAALLPIQTAALGDGWSDAFEPGLMVALLRDTTVGLAWTAQVAATLLLLATAAAPPRWRDEALAGVSALLLATLTLTGHAAMREGWLGVAQRGNDLLHLLAGGFWLGALPPLLPTLRALSDPQRHAAATVALRRFSWLGHGAVALVIATGVLNATLILGHWPVAPLSPYTALLAAKAVLVAGMTGLAVVNRYRYVPRLARQGTAVRMIRRATWAEIALGFGAVGLVALFGLLEPTA